MRPPSKGYLELRSSDVRSQPRIVLNYLSDPRDQRALMDAARQTDEIVQQRAWDVIRGEALSPPVRKQSDSEVTAWLKASVSTQYHPCSSCRMGVDDMSVVNASGNVHGVEKLRIVDASILPTSISGNPHCPTIMVAEKLSDDIQGVPALEPDLQPYAR